MIRAPFRSISPRWSTNHCTRLLCLICLLLFSNNWARTQVPGKLVPTGKSVFGGKNQERGVGALATATNEVLVIATTQSSGAGKQDALLRRLDREDQEVWSRTYGSPLNDQLNAGVATADGGFVLVGLQQDDKSKKDRAWLLKIDGKGDTLWQQHLNKTGPTALNDIIELPNGELLATGYATQEGKRKLWVYNCYQDGTFKRELFYGDDRRDEGLHLSQGTDGHIAVAAMTTSGRGNRNIRLLILDEELSTVAHHIHGSRVWEEVNDLIACSKGGFALVGTTKRSTNGQDLGGNNIWLLRTTELGELKWEQTLGGAGDDAGLGLIETALGQYFIVGSTYSHLTGANTSRAIAYTVSEEGEVTRRSDYLGGKGFDDLSAATLLSDGSVIAVGTTNSKSEAVAGKSDAWVMRFAGDVDWATSPESNLVMSDFALLDADRDGQLEERESAYLAVTITNTSEVDAYQLRLELKETSGLQGIDLRQFTFLPFLRAGASRRVRIKVAYAANTEPTDATFHARITDAGRSATEALIIDVPVHSVKIPPNWLEIGWLSPVEQETGITTVYQPELPILLKARSDQKLFSRYFTITLNGEPYQLGSKSGGGKLRRVGSKRIFDYEYNRSVLLQPGLNTIQVTVANGERTEISRELVVEYSDKPNLHVLAIGISHDDLAYTRKDAQDFVTAFTGQEGKLFGKVRATLLVDNARTPDNRRYQTDGTVIKETFTNLLDGYQYNIFEDDLLVVFLSSHGEIHDDRFKIMPSDYGMGMDTYVDFKEDILAKLEGLNCHKLLFVDACHSGGGTSGGPAVGAALDDRAKALANLNATLKTTTTIASCGADESSWEDESWENGAFTEALIGAFSNEAYEDAGGSFLPSEDDAVITLEELYAYLRRRVPAMVESVKKERQTPTFPLEALQRVKALPVFEFTKPGG